MFLKIYLLMNLTFPLAGKWLIKIKTMRILINIMTIFWLLGPFIYLIERDPADLWLSLIGVIFLFRCIQKKGLELDKSILV